MISQIQQYLLFFGLFYYVDWQKFDLGDIFKLSIKHIRRENSLLGSDQSE